MKEILEKAIEYGFKPVRLMSEKDLDENNAQILSFCLTDRILEKGAVVPSAGMGRGKKYSDDSFDEERSVLDYLDYLAENALLYGLKVEKVQEALAKEFRRPAGNVSVAGKGPRNYIFYLDKKELSDFLRENFEEKTVYKFKMK